MSPIFPPSGLSADDTACTQAHRGAGVPDVWEHDLGLPLECDQGIQVPRSPSAKTIERIPYGFERQFELLADLCLESLAIIARLPPSC